MPIFVVQKNGDIDVFSSPDEAGAAMESPDIESGEYIRAFDEKGNVLAISTFGTAWHGKYSLTPRPGILTLTTERDTAGLHDALRRRFAPQSLGSPPTLEELMSRAITASEVKRVIDEKRTKNILRVLLVVILTAMAVYALLHVP